jgi:hypothetical protein
MIKLRDLLNEEFTAISSKSGKTVVFKNKDARDAAVKAGTHEVPEDEKGGKDEPKGDKPNMFSKDAGYDAPDAKTSEPTQDTPKDNPFGVDRLVYNKRTKTVGIVRMADDGDGEVKTDADGNVNVDELEPFNPMKYPHQNDAKAAPSTRKEIDSRGLFQPFAQNGPIIREPKAEPKSEPKSDNKLSLSKRGIGFDMTAANTLEDELGGGISDLTDDGVITFSFGENDKETSLYFGKEDGQFAVSVENPYGDDFGDVEYFDNEADAIAHAKELANKYSKELGGSSNEGTIKLINLLRK